MFRRKKNILKCPRRENNDLTELAKIMHYTMRPMGKLEVVSPSITE